MEDVSRTLCRGRVSCRRLSIHQLSCRRAYSTLLASSCAPCKRRLCRCAASKYMSFCLFLFQIAHPPHGAQAPLKNVQAIQRCSPFGKHPRGLGAHPRVPPQRLASHDSLRGSRRAPAHPSVPLRAVVCGIYRRRRRKLLLRSPHAVEAPAGARALVVRGAAEHRRARCPRLPTARVRLLLRGDHGDRGAGLTWLWGCKLNSACSCHHA